MVNKRILGACALVSVLVVGNAFGAEEGFFIGVGGGVSTAKADADIPHVSIGPPIRIDYDEDGDAFKAYGGINFTNWFGIEGGYVQFGDTENSTFVQFPGVANQTLAEVEVKPNGWQGFGVVYLPLGNFDIFAKVGGIASNIDVETTSTTLVGIVPVTNHSDRSEGNGMMAYGAGAMWNFGHWAIRGEYEAYDVDKLDDLYVVSGSLQYTFFREKETPAPVVAAPAPAPAPKPMVPAKCPGRRQGRRLRCG